ncbi:WRKY domain-containing protein [Artemisia annua]|uniref:WRKY domain-containing protein n=1 Tax=Artemisia annua TaxID=35608 RepID=A0A2U1MA98_ARTAN|nr:WRKY domain-containing protein [Artemisia annua]
MRWHFLQLDLKLTNIAMEMESSSWTGSLSCKRLKAIQELTRGQQLTNKLREMLRQQEKIESDLMLVDGVVAEILGMFDNTLSILNSYTFNEKPHIQTHDMRFQSSVDDQQSHDSGESEKSVRPVKNKRGCYKRGYELYSNDFQHDNLHV